MDYDLCITGAGPAGCAAAYTASKDGLKTLLIEKNNYLGGLMTGGLVVPVMKTDTSSINTEFFEALVSYAKKMNAQIEYHDKNRGWFNPNILKIVLDKMMFDAGVKILFEYSPKNVFHDENTLCGVEFCSNLLSIHIESKYYLDSTGDSVIFKLLNEKFCNENSKKQPCSLRFIMSGVDLNKLQKFLYKKDLNREVTNSCIADKKIHLTSAYTWDKNWGLAPVFKKALDFGDLLPFDTAYFQIFTIAGANGSIAFNCPSLPDFDINDPYARSNALIEARMSIYRLAEFVKKYFDGFENAYISQIADMTGVRESNNILPECLYSLSSKMPENPVLTGDYPVDIHSNEKGASTLKYTGKYYMGINSLISKKYTNLYAAGRNLGADTYARSALRTQANCMSMGEAVARHVKAKVNLI